MLVVYTSLILEVGMCCWLFLSDRKELISTFWRNVYRNTNAEWGLSVVLQSLSIKEMQSSIDLTAAEVSSFRSMTILTPFPEQNVKKFTQQQYQMASSMPSVMIKEKLIFRFVNTFVENTIVPVKTVLGENSKKHLISNFFSLSSDNVTHIPPNSYSKKILRVSGGRGQI